MVFTHQICWEPDPKVLKLPLSQKYGLYLLIPGNNLQLWTLSWKYKEALYLLPLRIVIRVTCWAGMEWSVILPLPRLSISGSGNWLLGWFRAGVGERRKSSPTNWKPNIPTSFEKLSHFWQYPSGCKFNNVADRNIFFSDTNEHVPWLGMRRQIRTSLNSS